MALLVVSILRLEPECYVLQARRCKQDGINSKKNTSACGGHQRTWMADGAQFDVWNDALRNGACNTFHRKCLGDVALP